MLPHYPDAETMVAARRPEEPVYCLRPRQLEAAARRFLERFPGRVLYAVKANPAEPVLDGLHAAGIRHFDTASLTEIALIKDRFPEAGAYFMHPVKGRAAIRSAWRDHGVRHFVVDQAEELDKLRQILGGPDGKLPGELPGELVVMVRLATPGGAAVFDLSEKFGAPPEAAVQLLQAAQAAGARAGLAFHVGSQCTDPEDFGRAFALSRAVIAAAGVAIACLDVGGGFPAPYAGSNPPPLEAFMAAIDRGLAETGLPEDCVLMCEPGRVLVAEALSLVVQVQLRRGQRLYVNDGVYGSLHGARIGYRYPARLIRLSGPAAADTTAFTLYGPTCDGLDVLPDPFVLPADTAEGDWIEIGMTGAYSNALTTGFNGFLPETFVTLDAPFDAAATPAPQTALA